ncbi:MAG: hypothetical protein HYS89_01895 [Candidatus Colwellbacteria bacterium]|nr:hypothetical protein [Candidatus Colwellbacteria bacterium]
MSGSATAPLSLIAPVEPGKDGEAVMPIRFCVDRRVVQEIKDKKIHDLHVLMVVTNAGEEMSRHLVPLTAEMEYVQFYGSGANTIHATVVGVEPDGDVNLQRALVARDREGQYKWNPISFREEFHHDFGEAVWRAEGQDDLVVVVPESMFAKEPPKWFKKVIGFFWETPTRDQCHLRKRVLALSVISPVLIACGALYLVLNTAFKLAAALLLFLWGARGVNIVAAFKPLEFPNTVWKEATRSVWFFKEKKGWRWIDERWQVRPVFFLVFNPVVVGGLALVLGVIWFFVFELTWWVIVYAAIVAAGAGILATGINYFAAGVAEQRKQRREQRRRAAVQRRREAEDREYMALVVELESMACNGDRQASLKSLPRGKQTVHLRFQSTKAAICRPYTKK